MLGVSGTLFTNMVAVLFYFRFFVNNAVLNPPGTAVVILDEQSLD